MAISDVEAVLEYLRKNGLSESESALMEDIMEKSHLGSSDFQRFLFPMVPPPPPLRIPSTRRMTELSGDGGEGHCSSASSSQEEFVSLASSTTEFCSSEFTNPYGVRTATRPSSQASSDRLSQFGTARDYPDFDMQNDLFWYKEKDEDYLMPPDFGGSDSAGSPSEDKFVMMVEKGTQKESQKSLDKSLEGLQSNGSTNYFDKPWPLTIVDDVKDDIFKDNFYINKEFQCEGRIDKCEEGCMGYSCSSPSCACCGGAGEVYGGDRDLADRFANLNLTDEKDDQYKPKLERHAQFDTYRLTRKISAPDCIGDFNVTSNFENKPPDEDENYRPEDYKELAGEPNESDAAADEEGIGNSEEVLMYETNEDDYEVFHLRIIHRKNRTGFEENRDLPIVLNSIIAGRYYVTEYLGSAAFSKVVQAHDLHMGMDVCLKIIKNDKDFFDQSLDEIKLLKFVNKHDPGDQHHVLRLYDYFYHQEHLFIVCELLRANLYEFQKYNRESEGEPYFTLSRLQVITRQCLEALEFLHGLGIIHCDLKPENILIKSYRRCEIKVIDLGSSCFQTDNLSLYVQSRSYRAPEVILGLPYDHKIDLWSLGCILAELVSGQVLFPNETIVMMLARMLGTLGPIDMDMLLSGQETPKYFTSEFDLYHMNEETNQLEYIIPEKSHLENHLQVSDSMFIDFVKSLLEINPKRRSTAWEARQHPWLSQNYESSPYRVFQNSRAGSEKTTSF